MLNIRSKKNSLYLKAVSFFLFSFFITTAQAQNDAVVVIKGQTLLKARAKGLGLNMGVKGVDWKEEPMEGIDIEVKKNDATILQTKSEKKGKYSIQIPVSTADSKNDYTIYFSKEGMAPRTVNINAYLSKEEFTKYSSAKYDFALDVPLIQTSVKDIVGDKSYAKIKWDNVKEHKFSLDLTYAKVAQGEEQKITANPDLYYTSLAKKKKKQEDALAKNKVTADAKLKAEEEAKKKADEDARLKAEADAKILAEQKAKAEADRIEREKAEALKKEAQKKHIADSLAEVERKKAQENTNAKVEIKKIAKPVFPEQIAKSGFEGTEVYDLNVAKTYLKARQTRMNKEKGRNISAKYETNNILTSLLDMVDENDKNNKKQ